MALYSLRLRRTLTTLSSINRFLFPSKPSTSAIPSITSFSSKSSIQNLQPSVYAISGPLRWNHKSLYSTKQYKVYKEGDEITPDMVLFEGCDYNHWLITMDFPKDNPPSREEMIATYEQTCAKGLNISLEEAKTKIYACSTTTYQGFQALMTEEESERFKDVPGVVFILPDSYIDPVNKEYGGDKYENGVITPRPPPVQYGRGPRGRDRNRYPEQPRYGNQGGQVPNRQGNPSYNQNGPMQGDGRNFGPPQSYAPQQNYGPPGQGERSQMPMNSRDYAPGGRDSYQADRRGYAPPYHGNPNQGGQGNSAPQEQTDFPPRDRMGYAPVHSDNRGYAPQQAGNFGQAANSSYGQSPGVLQQDQRNVQTEPRNYAMGQTGPNQRDFGDSRNSAPGYGGTYGQTGNSSYGQSYGEGQKLPQGEQWSPQGEPRNHAPLGQSGPGQGRY